MFEVLQISVPEATSFQYYLAFTVLLFLAFAVVYIVWNARYHGLPEENSQVKSDVLTQLHRKTPNSVRIPASENPKNYRLAIRSTMLGDSPDRETIRSGSKKFANEVRQYWNPVLEQLPRPVLKTWTAGVLVAVFGAIAVSTSAVVALLTKEAEYPSLSEVSEDLRFYTVELFEGGRDLVFQFPYGIELWELVFAYAFLFADWLYNSWPVLATILVIVGAWLYAFERSKLEEPGSVFDSSLFGVRTIGYVFVVWMSGVIPSIFLRNLGFDDLSSAVGFLVAFVTAIWIVTRTVKSWYRSFDQFPKAGYAYFSVKSGGRALVWTGWVIVSLYVIDSITNGQFAQVADAFWKSPVENKILAAVIVLSPVGKTLYEVRNAWPELKAGFVETSSRTRVKTKLLRRGIPYLGVAFGYVIIFAFTRNIIIGTIGAVGLGVLLRLVYSGMMSLKFGKNPVSYEETIPSSVLVQSYRLDVDGREKFLVVLNGDHRYAADDVDELCDEVILRVDEVGRSNDPTPSVYGHHATDLIQYGISSMEETRTKLVEQTRKSLLKLLRTGDGTVGRDRLRSELGDLPPDFVNDKVTDYVESGVMSRDPHHLILERDPWAN